MDSSIRGFSIVSCVLLSSDDEQMNGWLEVIIGVEFDCMRQLCKAPIMYYI